MLPLAIVRPHGSDTEFSAPDEGVRYAQLEPGLLTIGRHRVSLAPIEIFRTRFNLAIRAEAEIAEGNTVLTLLADERTHAQWFGCAFGRDDVAVGHTRVDISTRGPSAFYSVSVAGGLGCPDGFLTRDPVRTAGLRGHLVAAMRNRRTAKHLLDFLAVTLDREPGHSMPLPRRVAAVRRCEEYVLEHVDANPTLQELSAVSGLGLRSLINAFRAVTGFSPMAYLKTQRLNAVRRILARADRARTRVIDVAAEWGFWHMGHFASDYRALFGETPSQTLNRASRTQPCRSMRP